MFGSLFKGWMGEKVTQFGLWHHLNDQTYRRFHDVIVPARNGTTQIDHVLVSCYGIAHRPPRVYHCLPALQFAARGAHRPVRSECRQIFSRLQKFPQLPVRSFDSVSHLPSRVG